MDEQDRTDLTDNTEQTPRSEQNPGQPESAAVNFVMQDIPAGQNHEEVRPASTLQGTYAQHRAQQTPPGSDGRQANYNNIGGYPPQSNTQWRQSTPPPFGGGGQVPPMGPRYGGGMGQPIYPPVKTKSKNAWKVWVALLCIVCLCASVIGGVYLSNSLLQSHSASGDGGEFQFPSTAGGTDGRADVTKLQNSNYETISDIAEDLSLSVVTIITSIESVDMFNMTRSGSALGSGIIIGESGDELYIATNHHVLSDAKSVSVIIGMDDAHAVNASLKGSDQDTDLAVIYLKKSEIPDEVKEQIKIATLGDSDSLRLGDLSIAIGSPVDKSFGNTVTVGSISGLERTVQFQNDDGTSQSMILLQTDAAINPGNSGGALVNGRGEVVGINNAKLTSTDIEGMGFAIPINTAKPILEQLINEGKIRRPYLGITGVSVEDLQNTSQYNLVYGVYVATVVENGPAAKAGVQANDVIISFNGQPINVFDDLTAAIKELGIGGSAEMEILRGYIEGDAQTVTLQVTIEEKPSSY